MAPTKIRVRFAPSPTGPLHIGGVRTALYNYLFAKKHKGTFILRIEDTDQNRYVHGAEQYIIESLLWCGLKPDEGPGFDGAYGPYRQSERKDLYAKYAHHLVASGHAYYAFDTPEELDKKRAEEKTKGNHAFKYDQAARMHMRNSLSLSGEAVEKLLADNTPYTIRLKVPAGEEILVEDLVRGTVSFKSEELDDKILRKADGMPTYHMANVVDDYLMEISHVIRGEEWLPSTAHHVLLYRFLGWEATMPEFAHLPLILKPNGKGKLSKRDGAKFGFPVFPLSWESTTPEDSFQGFREFGFDPNAVINFLAFLGWNPGTEQEIFSLGNLTSDFSIEHIGKSGARFDFDKAKWYNQQYLQDRPGSELAEMVKPIIEANGHHPSDNFLATFCELFKERVSMLPDFWDQGYYFFESVRNYDEKTIQKKWQPENTRYFDGLQALLSQADEFKPEPLEKIVKGFMEKEALSFGAVFPFLRIALSGTTKGPDLFKMMALLGKKTVIGRLSASWPYFNTLKEKQNG